jgi:rhodanese-related sulfurtransferase
MEDTVMRTSRVLGTVILILSLIVPSVGVGQEIVPTISPEELYEQRQSGSVPQVLDVRTPEEFRLGHIPGAVNIPHTELGSRIGELQNSQAVVLYCMLGPRARLGEKTLLDAGVENVLHLDGGLHAWQQAGFPVEKAGAE